MKLNELNRLSDLLQLAFERKKGELAQLAQRRGQVQTQLQALEEQTRSADDLLAQTPALTTTGVDLAWRAWVEENKRQLLMELAKLTALETQSISSARQEFGRTVAIDRVMDAAVTTARKKADSQQRSELEFQMILSVSSSRKRH